MNRWMPRVVFLLGLGWAMGCGGDSSTPAAQDVKYPDLGASDAADTAAPDVATADVDGDRVDGTVAETGAETADVVVEAEAVEDVGPVPGGPGYPCTDNTQCNSGVCIDSAGGKVCAQQCLDTCPDGYACKTLTIGPDVYLICMPLFLHLCDPCSTNDECNAGTTGGNAVCVDGGPAGKFCGGDCAADGFCPSGYACQESPDPQGLKSKQCVPSTGECACSNTAIKAGAQTVCYVKNDAGTCTGQRRCIVSGLTACDAATPAPEICDGLDNNCNGLTDENLGTQTDCEKHASWNGADHVCKGKGECNNGHIVNCDAATPVPETCNGLDDDCNGLTDDALCDDGNPCTTDFCNPGDGTCAHTPNSGSKCSTGNPCSVNDHCDDTGACIAGSQKNCDDGNPCTDDFCDTGTGDCKHTNNTKSCEDGDFCTVGDHCSNGACLSGAQKSCVEENNCRKTTGCDKKTGDCTWSAANENLPCTSTDQCLTGTKCSNGDCTGGADICSLKSCPVPSGKTFCAAPACSSLPAPLGALCFCACI